MRYSGEINDKFVQAVMDAEDRDIMLCSYGGDVGAMMAAIDIIKLRSFRIMGCGVIMSATVPILACGIEGGRTALPNTRFMVHKGALELGSVSSEELEAESTEMKYWEDLYWTILADNSKHQASWWKKKCTEANYYFSAKDALRYGIIDAIVE
jgi:ATP-dependent protease ClpP protease subunit